MSRHCLAVLYLLASLTAALALDTEAIRRVVPGAPVPMPAEVFPPAYRASLQAAKADQISKGLLTRADEYLKTPAATWRARLPVQVGYGYMLPGLAAPTEQFNATCPACLRPARFGKVDVYGGSVTMDCCGVSFPEDPQAYAPNAPGRPNRTFRLRHFDDSLVEYSCYEFPDRIPANQAWQPWKPADGGPLHEVFLPDGYIRANRLQEIMAKVIPDLGWAYFHTGESRYAELLCELYDRLAELYPTWPLWCPYGVYAFALNRAGDGLLTRAEYDSAIRPMRWGTQFWNTFERSYRFGHMKTGSIMPQYDMGQVAALVKAYACLRGSAAAQAWSQARYGTPDALDRRVMTGLFGEIAKLHACYEPWLGNYTPAGFEGSVLLSLLTQDRTFFDVANELMERALYDEAYADHAPTQGACSYWSMVYYPLANAFQMRKDLYDPTVEARHPRLAYLGADGKNLMRAISSQRWVLPAFGDTWNKFYHEPCESGPKPATAGALSSHFQDFGVSMLRWGEAEGRRQEICLLYQRISGHTHSDALNLEFFIDGMPVFWEMGYGNGTLDTDVTRYPAIREIVDADWPRPVLDTGPYYRQGKGQIPTGHWWSAEWNHRTVAHCTVLVDEQEPNPSWEYQGAGMPVTLLPETEAEPSKRLIEVIDIDEKGVFVNGPPVSEYRRCLLTVRTPGGGGYAVDVFRVTGGTLHEFLYHAISEKSTSSLPPGEAQPGTLAHYRERGTKQPERLRELDDPQALQAINWSNGYRYIRDLRRIDPEPAAWNLSWEYDPQLYAPRTAAARERLAAQLGTQKPVALAVHAVRQAGTEQQARLWRARGLLTGHLVETLRDGTSLDGGWRSNVGFVGGLDMLIEERRGAAGVRSVFAHVLEGRRADLPAEVTAVEPLPTEGAPAGTVALRVLLASGVTDYVFCLPEPGEVRAAGISFGGRYGLLRLAADGKVAQAALVRASHIGRGDFSVTANPEYAGVALRFEGDLSGDRTQPAIVVASEQDLPLGTALAGLPVQVTTPDGWADVYFIDRVSRAPDGAWRLALRDYPTFIIDFLNVGAPDPKDEYAFFPQQTDLTKAALRAIYGRNTTLVRLADGKEFPIDLVHADPHPLERVVLRDRALRFADCGLRAGDAAIILRHRPGDRVVVPLRTVLRPHD